MAKKKIKFALKLKEGVEVRNLQELREGFDLNQVVAYLLDGKLETWLMDRYYEDLAEKIHDLDKSDPELRKKLCKIFEVEYEEDSLSVEEIEERNRRIKKLKEITDDEEIIKNVDKVAFSQEELADLLDEGQKTIYLCGTDFHIPVSKKGIRYIGVETKLDITQEEREKYQANDIELIDLLEGYFDESKEEVDEETEELARGFYITLNGKKTWVEYINQEVRVILIAQIVFNLGYAWNDVIITVNGKTSTKPSEQIQEGDVVEITPKK